MNYISFSTDGIKANINEPAIQARELKGLINEIKEFIQLKINKIDCCFTEPVCSFALYNKGTSESDLNVTGEINTRNADVNFEFL